MSAVLRSWSARRAARPPRGCALDVGSARTRLLVPSRGVLLDEPTLLAYGHAGDVVGVGDAARRAASTGPVRLVHPVRHGRVVDPVGCVHLLRVLLARAEVTARQGVPLVIGVPVAGRAGDVSVTLGVAASAGGGRVVPVESSLAAAIGAGTDVTEEATTVVCDVGAGLVELAAVGSGQVLASRQVPFGLPDAGHDLDRVGRVLPEVARALGDVLDDLPPGLAADLVARPLLLVGGGGLLPGLAERLGAATRMPVRVADGPRDAVVRGLSACLG